MGIPISMGFPGDSRGIPVGMKVVLATIRNGNGNSSDGNGNSIFYR